MTILLIVGIAGIAIEFIDSGLRSPRHHRDDRVHSLFLRPLRYPALPGIEDVALFIAGILLLASEFFIPELRHPRHTGLGLA